MPSSAIEALWVAFGDVYGHKWTSANGEDPYSGTCGDTWAAGLSGLSPPQLSTGIKACIASTDPWPPALPEFRAMCLGIPSLPKVRMWMRDGITFPFVRLMWESIDGFRIKQVSADQADRMIRDAYELAREHVMHGGALPPAAAGHIEQEKPVFKPASPEVAEAAKQAIAAALRINDVVVGPDADEQAPAPVDRKSAAAGDSNA